MSARTLALAGLLLFRSGVAEGAPAPTPAACPAWQTDTDAKLAELQTRLVALVNEHRRLAGQAELRVDQRLSRVARAHAEHEASSGTMSHHLPETGSVEDRVRAAGLKDWDMVSENLARGRPINYTARIHDGSAPTVACHTPETLAQDLVRAWERSPGHSRTMHEPAFTHLGTGAAFVPEQEAVYVVHDFARLVTCGYEAAACCPPPPGLAGGVCQLPTRCRQGLCVLLPPPVE